MAATKISITVDDDLVAQVRDRVGPRGVSAFMNQAVRHELQLGQLAGLLSDLEAELGPADETTVSEVLASLERLEKRQSRPAGGRPDTTE